MAAEVTSQAVLKHLPKAVPGIVTRAASNAIGEGWFASGAGRPILPAVEQELAEVTHNGEVWGVTPSEGF